MTATGDALDEGRTRGAGEDAGADLYMMLIMLCSQLLELKMLSLSRRSSSRTLKLLSKFTMDASKPAPEVASVSSD